MHDVEEVTDHVPALQDMHVEMDVAAEAEDQVPAPQLVHDDEATKDHVPELQVKQVVLDVALETDDQVPALHPKQVDAPDTEYELGPQS